MARPRKQIITCPQCGSRELEFFAEYTLTKYFTLNKWNEPTKKCYAKKIDNCNNPKNFICNQCGHIFSKGFGTAKD